MPLILSPTGNRFIAPQLSFSQKILTVNQRWKKSSALGCRALSIRDEPSQEE
jgi:hypothetical protein